MSVKSMTGFGQGYAQVGGLRAEVEVSSVNRKQLDVMANLPRALMPLEAWLIEQVSRQLSRGRVHVQVHVKTASGKAGGAVVVNQELAEQCVVQLQRTAKKLGVSGEVTLSDLVRIPGILIFEEVGADVERTKPVVAKALNQALKAFATMRRQEGAALGRDLGMRLDQLDALVVTIAKRAPELPILYRETLRARIHQLAGGVQVDDERLQKEIILYADRSDITEELTRLKSHFQQARRMLRQPEPSGRPLDFLAQEMFREINTIASKAADAVVSTAVVHFKAELERFREQVQNIE